MLVKPLSGEIVCSNEPDEDFASELPESITETSSEKLSGESPLTSERHMNIHRGSVVPVEHGSSDDFAVTFETDALRADSVLSTFMLLDPLPDSFVFTKN